MQLILLSEGSGKRLWPINNDARSMQFLPLLSSPNGGMESMIQRVVRQIHEAKLTDNITFATNAVQRDSIINQLGEDVNVVTEPERRDTFPAICIRTSAERPEAIDKGDFIIAGIDEKSLLQAVDTAVKLCRDGQHGIPVPDYVDENVSTKVVKIVQSYVGIVNKIVWRKI